jgi:hypothetical protein
MLSCRALLTQGSVKAMRSFISHFSAWIAAVVCIAAIEVWYSQTFHPALAERSNFTSFGLEDNFVADQMQQILYGKLSLDTIAKPDFVQVGDSSGFFGIVPEVVERYLPGMKYLNASCCAIQGFNGYLALLRYNLRRFPSIKYMVVYSGILFAYPSPSQWRNAPRTLDFGGPVALKTLGEKMEKSLNPPWTLLDLPTNSLRQYVLQHTFLTEDVRRVVNAPKGAYEIIIDGLPRRQGYGLEMDHMRANAEQGWGGQGADTHPCSTLKYETFFDWASLRRKSYLDAFVEEYVALAHEFGVVPILAFQVSPCVDPHNDDVQELRANIKRLQQRFPELKVPFDIIDSLPENDFSSLLHVQREVALETSRRLGRALHAIVLPDDTIKTEAPPADATLTIMKATQADDCDAEADLTEAFGGECDGKNACDVDLTRWRRTSSKACRSSHIAEFRCSGGPVRIIRQETEDLFGGRFRLDCKQHDRWLRDEIPRGIQVADARFGERGGNPMGLVTLRTMAFCNGLMACDYAIRTPDGGPEVGDFSARWYCGSEQKMLQLPAARSGTLAHLQCP